MTHCENVQCLSLKLITSHYLTSTNYFIVMTDKKRHVTSKSNPHVGKFHGKWSKEISLKREVNNFTWPIEKCYLHVLTTIAVRNIGIISESIKCSQTSSNLPILTNCSLFQPPLAHSGVSMGCLPLTANLLVISQCSSYFYSTLGESIVIASIQVSCYWF